MNSEIAEPAGEEIPHAHEPIHLHPEIAALFASMSKLDPPVVALFVGGPDQLTLPGQMFSGVRFNISPTTLAAATFLVLISMLLVAGTQVLRSRALAAKRSL